MERDYNKEFVINTIKRLWPRDLPLDVKIEFVDGELAQSCIALPLNKTDQLILDVAIRDIKERFFPAIMANEIAHYVVFLRRAKIKFLKFRQFLRRMKNQRLETCLYNITLWIIGLRLKEELEDDEAAINLLNNVGYPIKLYEQFLQANVAMSEESEFPEWLWKSSLAHNRLYKFQRKYKRG